METTCNLKKTQVVKEVKESLEGKKFTHKEHNYAIRKLKPYEDEELATPNLEKMEFSSKWIELLIHTLKDKAAYSKFFKNIKEPIKYNYREALQEKTSVELAFLIKDLGKNVYTNWYYLEKGFRLHKKISSKLQHANITSFSWIQDKLYYIYVKGCVYAVRPVYTYEKSSEKGFESITIEDVPEEIQKEIEEISGGAPVSIYGVMSSYYHLQNFLKFIHRLTDILAKRLNNESANFTGINKLNYREYYLALSQGNILLSKEQCEKISKPVLEGEEYQYILMDKKKEIELYNRRNEGIEVVFKGDFIESFPSKGVVTEGYLAIGKGNKQLTSILKSSKLNSLIPLRYLLFSGKLHPIYSLYDMKDIGLNLYTNDTKPSYYLTEEAILEKYAVEISELPLTGFLLPESPYQDSQTLYDTSSLTGDNELVFYEEEELQQVQSFYTFLEKHLADIPKLWDIDSSKARRIGVCGEQAVLRLTSEDYKDTLFSNILNKDEIEDSHVIINIDEITLFKRLLITQGSNIMTARPLGLTKEGRAVLELRKYKGKEDEIPSAFSPLLAASRLQKAGNER